MLNSGLRQFPFDLMSRRFIHNELMNPDRAVLRGAQEGPGASSTMTWRKLEVESSDHTFLTVAMTPLFSRVVKPMMVKRKSGHKGSRGATWKEMLIKAQIQRWRRIWR